MCQWAMIYLYRLCQNLHQEILTTFMSETVLKKLEVLSAAAKYDVSCVSSGSSRKEQKGGLGNASPSGVCHSFTGDGRCVSLLKILYTNNCIYDCSYCVNRCSNDIPRASFAESEVEELTMHFYLRNYIEGLFLSSAIFRSPDYTMERLVQVVKNLRVIHRFNGYIHLKALPGADHQLITEAGKYVDRLSANIELPTRESLHTLAPQKDGAVILGTMKSMSTEITRYKDEKKRFKSTPSFIPAGQSTQLIVGASPESDSTILTLSEALYRKLSLRRVFYSAYVPVTTDPRLPLMSSPPLQREHRLYQADWLLRFYGFTAGELFSCGRQNLEEGCDPKVSWALSHLECFPLEINSAPYEMLLRVPGIGVRSARKIVSARRHHLLQGEDLKKMGLTLKRACYFITAAGKELHQDAMNDVIMRKNLIRSGVNDDGGSRGKKKREISRRAGGYEQLTLFPLESEESTAAEYICTAHGEL